MTIKVNGEQYTTETNTLSQLLQELGIIPERVAVEINLKIIKKADFDKFLINEGDVVEIVNFVGGGNLTNLVQ